jgi:hypothetical protein
MIKIVDGLKPGQKTSISNYSLITLSNVPDTT